MAALVAGYFGYALLNRFSAPRGEPAATLAFCTGANNYYGYFAPELPDEIAVGLTYTAADGRTWREDLCDPFGAEARHRAFPVIWSVQYTQDEPLRRTMMHSLAEWALERHPDAATVELAFTHRVQPSMAESRAGTRPEWQDNVRLTYHRGDAEGLVP